LIDIDVVSISGIRSISVTWWQVPVGWGLQRLVSIFMKIDVLTTPRSRVHVEKLIKKFPRFMEPAVSLPY